MMLKKKILQACFLVFAVFLIGACGDDDVAPSLTADIPPVIFFNGSGEFVIEGTAADNLGVADVMVAINGTDYDPASLDAPAGNNVVGWSYAVTAGNLPTGANVILVKAVDEEGNENILDPVDVESRGGTTTGDLLDVLTDPSLPDTIGLSKGVGDAYGDAGELWTITVDEGLILFGSGPETVLEAAPSHPRLFDVSADLTLRKMTVRGARVGVEVSGSADPHVVIENCSFDGQDAWAIAAVDSDEGVFLEFLSSTVDASSATDSARGGLYLEGITYEVLDSDFLFMEDPDGPSGGTVTGAAIQVVGGSGTINECLFEENALAIWAAGGTPVISSCSIDGGFLLETNGILFTGSSYNTSNPPLLVRNRIFENGGFGVMVSGDAPVVFENNSISYNGDGGVVLDYNFSSSDTQPVLGDCQAFNICDEGGRNSIFSNSPFDAIATDNTNPTDFIDAQGNFWGTSNVWDAHVDQVIQDGDTLLTTLRTPPLIPDLGEDFPNARAKFVFEPFDGTGVDPNP